MWNLTKPNSDHVARFLAEQRQLPLTFHSGMVAGFSVDHARVLLGQGEADYRAACQAIRQWRMFPREWTEVSPESDALSVGENVAVAARAFGVWWLNACRIVSLTDETHPARRFGFTYVTLPGHVEQGEEEFLVEWDADDRVWYQIRAVSRPRYWLVWLAYPLARRLQSQFRRDSMQSMQDAVRANSSSKGKRPA